MAFTIPKPESFAALMGDLLGRQLTARVCTPEKVRYPFGTAVYGSNDKQVTIVVLCELSLACAAAAALSMLPPGVAQESVKAGRMSDQLRENFNEVMNVVSHYLSSSGTRIALQSTHPPPDVAPPKLLKDGLTATNRLDLEIGIAGYEGGRLSFAAIG